MAEPTLQMSGIGKRFDGVDVLHGVDFELLPGEIHALVGENGAGKSTLMKIAAGVHQPDDGAMRLFGQPFHPRNPTAALNAGVAMVHQELSLARDLSIAENVLAGREPVTAGFVRWKQLFDTVSASMKEFDLNMGPDTPVSELGAGHRQVVEVLKALAASPKVVLFDEPTSSLEAHETELVLNTVRRLAERGISVVYTSHRMAEVFAIADRVSVLRDGGHVGTWRIGDISPKAVIDAMVGRDLSDLFPAKPVSVGDPLLKVDSVGRPGAEHKISFTLHRNEILGLAGLIGSGRTEAMRLIFGVDRMDSGRLQLEGTTIADSSSGRWSVSRAIASGLAYVPEDRKTLGLFLDRSIEDNLASANLDRCSRSGVVVSERTHDLASKACRRLGIRSQSVDQVVSSLSGGNQQKTLLARWLATEPKVLIVDEPTRGVDVGAKSEIHRILREFADQGRGVIVVSSEMPELIGLCDRILVMHEGRIVGEASGVDMTEQRLIDLAIGGHSSRPPMSDGNK
ncbi:MAG: sugar ABC transporter ATP-binding protein [Fimbriimonas sp.]|nr:sugar ABC transporter ATP-binding protein [Fimbriimonas sp.]